MQRHKQGAITRIHNRTEVTPIAGPELQPGYWLPATSYKLLSSIVLTRASGSPTTLK